MRQSLQLDFLMGIPFQSTHPHGVRRRGLERDIRRGPISIHAPARGATNFFLLLCLFKIISIHAPARGATSNGDSTNRPPSDFNPRTRTGCDVSNRCFAVAVFAISIHAPARGATVLPEYVFDGLKDFNPRTRTGCDCNYSVLFRRMRYFNPRTRTGCDELS